MKHFALLGIGVVLGVAIILGAWFIVNRNYTYQGVLIDPPAPAANFTLTDQNGKPFQLSDQRGKVVLIFFGYTNCADVCPITMTEFKKIKAGLGNKASDVEFVFVSVDPERDTPERMKVYVDSFDPGFTGLTGERAALEPVWKAYGVYVEKQAPDSSGGYEVNHPTRTYVIDVKGNWRLNYPFGTDANILVEDILHLLQEKL